MSGSCREQFQIAVDRTWDGSPVDSSERVEVRWKRTAGLWSISFRAPYHGDQPPSNVVGSTDRLWNYEVVELFVASDSSQLEIPEYSEIELGPHGHYRILCLRGIRNVIEIGEAHTVDTVIRGSSWTGSLSLSASLLPTGPYKVNAYAIHGEGAERRFLASIPVPGTGPDFHQPDLFRSSDNYLAGP